MNPHTYQRYNVRLFMHKYFRHNYRMVAQYNAGFAPVRGADL